MFRPLAERPGTVSICPECNQPFKSANSPHAPLILHCGHLCCEECIRTALSTERVIMCKECNTTSTTKTSPDVKQSNLRDSFPLSEKMIEEINKLTQMKPVDESCIGFKSSKKLSIEKQSPNTSLHDDACGECHTIIAVLKCVDCKGTLFCEKCWAQVHSFKTNQDHEYVNISSKPFKPLEKKPEYTKLLKEHHERLLKKQEKLECSIKIISNPALINDGKSSGMDMQQIGDDLKQFFMYCQNTIKSMENKVMKEYESIAYSLDHSQTKCYRELNHTRNEIVELARELYEICGNDFYELSSVETLLAKSNELLEKPDMVMMERPVSGSKGITLPSNEWIAILESQLNFDFGKAGEFKLVKSPLEGDTVDMRKFESRSTPVSPMSTPCSNTADHSFENVYHCSEDASLSYGEGARYQSNGRRPSKTYSVHSVQLPLNSNSEYSKGDHRRAGSICDMERMNLAQRTSRIQGSNPTTPAQICGPSFSCLRMGPQSSRTCYDQKITKTRSNFGRQVRFREGWRGSVVISCIFTPSYFFVQLESGLPVLEKYRKFFMKAGDHPTIDRADIKTGNMYLAHCLDGEWYRVRLSEVIPNEQLVQVTQIDTGKVEVVDMRKLRRIDDVMRSAAMDSELAIQCSMFDCNPIGTVWTREDNEAFVQILKDKRNITMLVKKVRTNKLEVDLIWNDKSSEISIRDYMLMSKTACLASRKDILNTTSAADSFKYFKDTEYQPKKCVDVKVTYVYGPDEFYVKRVDPTSDKLFKHMNQGLDGFYKNNNNYKCYQVLNPAVGLPVAAQFSVDNLWYRAELLSINPQSKKAEVRYVDFGNKESLSFSRIRQLAKEYIRFSVQAVKCSLIGIKPINGNYISGCTNFLIKNVDDLVLKMVVEEVKDNQLDVILFRCNEDEDVCLNLLLVENGFARRVGNVLGTVSSYPKRDGVRNSSSTTVVEKPVEVAQVDTPKQTEVPVTEVGSNDEVAESGSMISSSEEITPEDNSEKNTKEEIKYEVKMVNFISPDRFYVTLTLQVNIIQQINNEMCKFYRDEKNSQELLMESVEKNAKCVAYSENHKKWNRAKVLEVKENGDIFVFYTDFGYEETVKLKDLRKLTEKFNKMCDGVVVCHMANIENRTNWPNRLCESLRTHLNDYSSLHITKVPKEPGKSTLPVELWGKMLSFQGPFDPAIEEWTNVNRLLAKALQNNDPSELDSNDLRAERESVENVVAEVGEISSNESVKKWLYSSVEEAAEKGIEFSEDVAKGKIPQERLISSKSPAKSISNSSKSTVSKTNDVEQEAGTSSGIPSRDWKLPKPILAQEFDVMPTYINEEFCIYVQVLGKHDKIVIDMISKGLKSKFENTTPLPMDLHWYPGQICIAWFFLDKQWYRGRVLKVDGERAFVEYVDFGNTEWVEVIHLRKDIILEYFPIQCHKLPIRSDCKPLFEDGKWPTKILDLVHATILERKCRIKLRKEKGEDFYRVEKLFLEDTGIELFDYLCQLGYATIPHSPAKRKEKKKSTSLNASNLIAELENEQNEAGHIAQSDSSSSIANVDSVSHLDFSEFLEIPGVSTVINDPFNIPQNPQDNEIIVPYCEVPVSELNIVTVQVIEILQMNEIVVHIVDCDNDAMNLNRNLFLEMNAELQVKGAEQPLLKSPSLGRMCCTKFDDDVWYRAKIIDCSDNEKVSILYVDYGNSSSVHPHELHEMKRSWFDVPIQSIRCQLIDYEIPNDIDEMLSKLINNEFEAVLEGSGEPHNYKIKLFFK